MKKESCKVSRWQLLKRELNNLPPPSFKAEVERDSDAIVLDVRTQDEFARGALLNARNISYLATDLWDQLEVLDPQRTYYVYCRTGRRSIRVCTLMQNGGFSRVYNLEGGLLAWEELFPDCQGAG